MEKKRFWEFVGDNFMSIATIIAGVLVFVLSSIGLISDKLVISAILGLLSLLATSEIVDKTRKLNRIEELTRKGFEQTVRDLQGVHVRTWSWTDTNGYLRYLQKRFREARLSIDHAALSPPLPRWFEEMKGYEEAIQNVLTENKVRYRYIAVFEDPARVERVKRCLTNKVVKRYFVGYYDIDAEAIPIPSFSIIDEEEVLLYFPTAYGELEAWISIRHKDVARAYTSHFRRLWEQSHKLTVDMLVDGTIDQVVHTKVDEESAGMDSGEPNPVQ